MGRGARARWAASLAADCALVAALLLPARVFGQSMPRWEPGPDLGIGLGARTSALHDGRLLTCSGERRSVRCELVDPLTSERLPSKIDDPRLFDHAAFLSDGRLLDFGREVVVDPQSGAIQALPPSGRKLEQMRVVPLGDGRAALYSVALFPPHEGARLFLFLGADQALREIDAGPPGTRISGVFDLGDGRLLVGREVPRPRDRRDLDLLVFSVPSGKWVRGAQLPFERPVAAVRNARGIVVLLAGRQLRALHLSEEARALRFEPLWHGGTSAFAVQTIDDAHVVLHGSYTPALLWDVPGARITAPPVLAPRLSDPLLLKRNGKVVLVGRQDGLSLVLALDAPVLDTPCDLAFRYTKAAGAHPGRAFQGENFEALLDVPGPITCIEHLERVGKLPDGLQAPLERLATRPPGLASPSEEAAAHALCLLAPTFSGPLIATINRPGMLRAGLNNLCDAAREKIQVLHAVRGRGDVGAALARVGLYAAGDRMSVRSWVVPFLKERPEIARAGGRLLLRAHEPPAFGFDALRVALCAPVPRRELADACERTRDVSEQDYWQAVKRRSTLATGGVLAGTFVGLGALAYVGRHNALGRGVAIGSGIAGGGALAGIITLSAGGGGNADWGTALLAIPISVLGAVGGGALATYLSRDEGTARFATAAVPLSAALATTVVVTIDDL